jgi:hypothetical protein
MVEETVGNKRSYICLFRMFRRLGTNKEWENGQQIKLNVDLVLVHYYP